MVRAALTKEALGTISMTPMTGPQPNGRRRKSASFATFAIPYIAMHFVVLLYGIADQLQCPSKMFSG